MTKTKTTVDISKIKNGDTVKYYPNGVEEGLVCEVITCASGTLMLRNVSDVYIIKLPAPGAEISEDRRAFIEIIENKQVSKE